MVERIYTINLKKAVLKVPRWKRANRAVAFVKEFLKRHMKVDEVKLDKSINEKIWERGAQKPPKKIRIKVVEVEEGEGEEKRKVAKAQLWEVVEEGLREEELEEEKKEKVEKKG